MRISRDVVRQILAHARQDALRECCGLLAGRDAAITQALPAANASPKPQTSYEIAPTELFRLMREMRAAGLDLLGIYHSHPNGKNEPSVTDIERAYYSQTAYFILSPLADAPRPVRAFAIREGRVTELETGIV